MRAASLYSPRPSPFPPAKARVPLPSGSADQWSSTLARRCARLRSISCRRSTAASPSPSGWHPCKAKKGVSTSQLCPAPLYALLAAAQEARWDLQHLRPAAMAPLHEGGPRHTAAGAGHPRPQCAANSPAHAWENLPLSYLCALRAAAAAAAGAVDATHPAFLTFTLDPPQKGTATRAPTHWSLHTAHPRLLESKPTRRGRLTRS